MSDTKEKPRICLTIAGLDPSGGAGVVADIKTFSAFGCFGAAAITSVTFQNTTGVFGSVHQTSDSVRRQVQPVIDDLGLDALKTGMLPTAEIIEEVARIVRENGSKNLVVDPVVRSTSGYDLIDDDALRSLTKNLFSLAELVTPNIPEAERITGVSIESERDIEDAAGIMREMGAKNVLIKGGHLLSKSPVGGVPAGASPSGVQVTGGLNATDYLFLGPDLHKIDGPYHETTATHGTGCVLSAAIAANLSLGRSLSEAVRIAKGFVNQAIRTAPYIGRGHSPINIR
jgi:hydroxymethylpyrimidine kinase/phosphomethylpyrimidine kinase